MEALAAHFNRGLRLLGPILILVAITLISLCTYAYFTILLPLHFPDPYEKPQFWMHLIFACWLVVLIAFNYSMAIFVGPGKAPPIRASGTAYQEAGQSLVIDIAPSRSGSSTSEQRPMRTCAKCNSMKPERAHHCSVCNNCNLKMDHHCPWLNVIPVLYKWFHFVLDLRW
jgi:palmitoyltransferase